MRWSRSRSVSAEAGAREPSRRERGIALLLVVWVLALVAVLATGFADDTRSEARRARNLADGARARAAAEAGVMLAVAGLLDRNPATQWPRDGRLRRLSYAGAELAVAAQDESGKVDLNASAPELFTALVGALGIDDVAAAALTEAVTARRRALDAIRARGENDPSGDPAARPFWSVEELAAIPGVSRAAYERLAPFVTVYSGSRRIDPRTAPAQVLLAVPGVDPQEVERLLAARLEERGARALPRLTGVESYVGPGTFVAATVTATAVLPGGSRFERRAVVGVTADPARPYRILSWRQGGETASPER